MKSEIRALDMFFSFFFNFDYIKAINFVFVYRL